MKVVPIVSGGLDSVTLLYYLLDSHVTVDHMVSFNYGQRHKKELEFAKLHAESLSINHHIIDLYHSGLYGVLCGSGSSLVDETVDVPEGHYAADNMKATVVPNRNMMMLAIAGSVAVATDANAVVTGVHAGDHFIYPDCRPEFIEAMDIAMVHGNEGFGSGKTHILAPFVHWTKNDIAKRAFELNVPIEKTWSCYKGGAIHCGKCGTCVERLEALTDASHELGTSDPTEYEDTEYWMEVLHGE